MPGSELHIKMLGSFSIQCASQKITDNDNRSRKVWLLLAYMIYCRKRPITTEELSNLLWSESEGSSNPANALKTTLHRVRTSLDQLYDGAGHQLIVRRQGSYAWNPDVSVTFDADDFDRLCKAGSAAEEEETRLSCWLNALDLYEGDFLPKLSNIPWVVPISSYFHHLYVQTVLGCLPLLVQREQWESVCTICRKAVDLEPYNEQLYRYLMRSLQELGQQQESVKVYEAMSERFLSTFGIMPSDETRALYREIIRTDNYRAVSPDLILEQLREPISSETLSGALICDYDFFKIIYQSVARSLARSGNAAHFALISLIGAEEKDLSKRSLDRAMENIREIIRTHLRRGDVAAQCSASQFILLLPQANYENAQAVCQRLFKAFHQQYPHSPAQLNVSVQALEPRM